MFSAWLKNYAVLGGCVGSLELPADDEVGQISANGDDEKSTENKVNVSC